jgi:hypothetical protein
LPRVPPYSLHQFDSPADVAGVLDGNLEDALHGS